MSLCALKIFFLLLFIWVFCIVFDFMPSFANSSNFSFSVSSIVKISKVSSPFLNIDLFFFSEDSKADMTKEELV